MTGIVVRCSMALILGWLSSTALAQGKPNAQAVKAVSVGVQTVEEAMLDRPLPLVGTLIAHQGITLQSQVEAKLIRINMPQSGSVQQGQVLVQLDDAQPQAVLAEARATAREAERKWQELSRLAKVKAVSNTELESQRTAVAIAQAKVASAQATVDNYRIVAPFSGEVGLYTLTPGQLIKKDTAMTSLDDLSQMTLDLSVPEKFLSQLKVGSSVVATTDALPGAHFSGVVAYKDIRLDSITLNGKVRIRFDNPQHLLRPGMLMKAELQLESRKLPLIPSRALMFQGEQRYVFVVEEGKAVQKPIRIARIYDDKVAVADGLRAGEQLVVDGTVKLRAGVAVQTLPVAKRSASAPATVAASPDNRGKVLP